MKKMVACVAVILLAACDSSGQGPSASANNASANVAGAAPEKTAPQSQAAPLPKEQALAQMKQRHEDFEKIDRTMKVAMRELKGEAPDLAQVRTAAATIAELAPQIPGWFPPGTGPDVGKTEARAEIWQKPEDFAAKAQAFRQAAAAFDTAARGSDLAAIRSAHADLGKTCRACHDSYREEE